MIYIEWNGRLKESNIEASRPRVEMRSLERQKAPFLLAMHQGALNYTVESGTVLRPPKGSIAFFKLEMASPTDALNYRT